MSGTGTHDAAPLLQVTDLRVSFGAVKAVDGVSFDLRPGEILGLVGESGSGKSTVGRAVLRINRVSSGSIRFEGTEVTGLSPHALLPLRRRMQMIFQDPRGSLDPRMKVGRLLAEPLEIHGLLDRQGRRARVAELLRLVGLAPEAAGRYPHQFSGGQAQRIAIARALALDPALIVADEPISSLDVSIQAQVINLLAELRRSLQVAMIFIAHDLSVVRHIADRVAVMYLGRIVEIADKADLYTRPGHPYTRSLLSAVPLPDPVKERQRSRTILKGELPSPENPPSGCCFSTRCPLRASLGDPPECTATRPQLNETGGGHRIACHFADPAATPASV
ncbi:ATP-binding cassette domain-containing protein [Psychromarinibacter sp. C21-152]|uniref:ATP-binding cassette domain-containing protein n=1 Tax=Psychromarinibacter sediminicola TaxID=3033385 RepID=A0AAE3NRR7_9RHOB|nr:oligopeptide/dipeptide ABC transporter ATP-binding protein [Psychromarinibacter sediminicola]MDF0601236.1 ATP-binding cassette domain-containing protein [Psychromarinibacter sediminicola]